MDLNGYMPYEGFEGGMPETFMAALMRTADSARALARPKRSKLFVGASVLASREHAGGKTYRFYQAGNIETLWQNSEHAEKNAIIIALNASLDNKIEAVCIAAERKLFTPCGGCCDIIWEFGGQDCAVLHYNPATKAVQQFDAGKLMPHYPTRA